MLRGSVPQTLLALLATFASLLGGAGVVGLAGCGRGGPATVLEPVTRLTDHLAGSELSERCAVNDEIRPALGCVRVQVIENLKLPWPEDGTLAFTARIPAQLQRRPMVIDAGVRSGKRKGILTRLEPLFLPKAPAQTPLRLPLTGIDRGDQVDVQVSAAMVPRRQQLFTTTPVEIGAGSELEVGLGFDSMATRMGAAPVEFVLTAHEVRPGATPLAKPVRRKANRGDAQPADSDAIELLREKLDPKNTTNGWVQKRISLAQLAGKTVELRFQTRVAPPPGKRGDAAAVGFPLWGAPQILAPRERGQRRNVILVSLDTLRGDHVGGTRAGRSLTPEIEALAKEGTVFRAAYATFPSTTASHMSMFTGLYPGTHHVWGPVSQLAEGTALLPQIFAQNGYETAAVTEDGMLAAAAGFERGFDSYREWKGNEVWEEHGQADRTFSTGLRWAEKHKTERFFLFLHTYEVHNPYHPPPEFDLFSVKNQEGAPPAPAPATGGDPAQQRIARMAEHEGGLYAGEVLYTDSAFGRLRAGLESLGLLDDAIIIVTSDHGEEFGEHGQFGHAKTIYDEVLHVPLVVWAPGLVPKGAEITETVSLVDLAPTLLDLVGLTAPPSMNGMSLRALLQGDATPADRSVFAKRAIYAEGPAWGGQPRLLSARQGGRKWILHGSETAPAEAYDLSADPAEKTNLVDPAAAEQTVRDQGQRVLEAYPQTTGARPERVQPDAENAPEANHHLDDRTEENLRALGYIE